MISRAPELGAEDAGAGHGAEDHKIEDEKQLTHHGDAAHLRGADLPDHEVVEKGHEIRYHVLQHERQRDEHGAAVKRPVANVLFQ